MTNATIYTVDAIKNAINHIAPNHKVKQVQLFGSYADNTATEKSDIDLLVEFGERPLTIWDIAGFKLAFCEYLNIDIEDVDIVNSLYPEKQRKI